MTPNLNLFDVPEDDRRWELRGPVVYSWLMHAIATWWRGYLAQSSYGHVVACSYADKMTKRMFEHARRNPEVVRHEPR